MDVKVVDSSSCSILADASRTWTGRVMQFLYNIPGLKAEFPPISSSTLTFLVLHWHRVLDIKLDNAEVLNNIHLILRKLKYS